MYNIGMSPTILKLRNIKLKIHTRDHKPAHIHAVSPDAEAKIDIQTGMVIENFGFSKTSLNEIVAFIEKHRALLIAQWKEIYEED